MFRNIMIVALAAILCFAFAGAGIAQTDSGKERARQDRPEKKVEVNVTVDKKGAEKDTDQTRDTRDRDTDRAKARRIQEIGAVRSSNVVGSEVRNNRGEDLGTINELVIAGKGDVVYVILSHGGFLGIGDSLLPIPWKALRFDPENEVAVIGMDKKILEKAPNFAENEWPDLNEPGWQEKLEGYYQDVMGEVKGEEPRETRGQRERERKARERR